MDDPEPYWLTGQRAADVLGVNRSRLGHLSRADFVPYVVHRDGTRLYRRDLLEVVAQARDARCAERNDDTSSCWLQAPGATQATELAVKALTGDAPHGNGKSYECFMSPVVFLILPVTLLFAFYPGVVGLNLLAP